MVDYMQPTYQYLDLLITIDEITAKEQSLLSSNRKTKPIPATPHFNMGFGVGDIVFPPFVEQELLRDCSNQLSTKKEMHPDE